MNHLFRFLGAGSLLLALAGCGNTFAMAPDSTVPFATGQVDADFQDNGNGMMTLKVTGLGHPSKLVPTATTYVAWVKPNKEGAKIQNVGVVTVDDDNTGELTFSTTFQSFELTITPEAAADVTEPAGRDILKTTITND